MTTLAMRRGGWALPPQPPETWIGGAWTFALSSALLVAAVVPVAVVLEDLNPTTVASAAVNVASGVSALLVASRRARRWCCPRSGCPWSPRPATCARPGGGASSRARCARCVPPRQRALVPALREFARAVGTEVLAEGVETRAQVDALVDIGVRLGQGWHLGVPVLQP